MQNLEKIYIVGDSHSAAFTIEKHQMTDMNKIYSKNNFISFRTFPYTCFNIDNKFEIIKNIIIDLNINKNCSLFISYGESDIRHHIGFHSTDSNLKENIKNIVSNYVFFLNKIKKIHNNLGVYAPIASGPYNGLSGTGIKSYKNSFERNKITKLFNTELEKQCYDNNIIFKTLFDKLIDKNQNTINDYFDICGIHLNPDKVEYLLKELFT